MRYIVIGACQSLSLSLLLLLMLHSAIPEMASGTAVAADGRTDGHSRRRRQLGLLGEGGRRHRCPLSEAKAQSYNHVIGLWSEDKTLTLPSWGQFKSSRTSANLMDILTALSKLI